MPRIDDLSIAKKVFKKKEYRSWDGNLIESLKLKEEVLESTVTKKDPTHVQSDYIADIESIQNRAQTGFIKSSNRVLKESNQGSDRAQSGSNGSSVRAQLGLNQSSEEKRSLPNKTYLTDRELIQKQLQKLCGNEKKIFSFIIQICAHRGELSTGEINGNEFNKIIGTSKNGRETAIKRLCNKQLIQREKIRCGPGAPISLQISELIKIEGLSYLNKQFSPNDVLGVIGINGVQSGFKDTVYSSSNIKNTTTRGNEFLSPEWLAINIEPLAHIGFTKNQLKQVVGLNSPEVVQESILHFAYALEHNTKYKTHNSPLNVIMGVLRKGQGWFEASYESPQDKALRELIEHRKKQKDRREKLIEDFVSSGFDEWLATLSKDQIDEILPKEISSSKLQAPKTSFLKSYYKENIVLPELNREGQL